MTRLVVLAGAFLFVVVISSARADTASDVLQRCGDRTGEASTDLANAEWCLGFLEALDGTHGTIVANRKIQPYFCMPEGAKFIQEKLAIVNWLKAHPEILHLESGASFFALAALTQTFPCR